VTYDIEHLRYRCTISNVKNVDIERAFDIECFDIECYIRYRTSDTQYRGASAKVPDGWGHGGRWRDGQGGAGPGRGSGVGPGSLRAGRGGAAGRARDENRPVSYRGPASPGPVFFVPMKKREYSHGRRFRSAGMQSTSVPVKLVNPGLNLKSGNTTPGILYSKNREY
jgi:hypothetical protein